MHWIRAWSQARGSLTCRLHPTAWPRGRQSRRVYDSPDLSEVENLTNQNWRKLSLEGKKKYYSLEETPQQEKSVLKNHKIRVSCKEQSSTLLDSHDFKFVFIDLCAGRDLRQCWWLLAYTWWLCGNQDPGFLSQGSRRLFWNSLTDADIPDGRY